MYITYVTQVSKVNSTVPVSTNCEQNNRTLCIKIIEIIYTARRFLDKNGLPIQRWIPYLVICSSQNQSPSFTILI